MRDERVVMHVPISDGRIVGQAAMDVITATDPLVRELLAIYDTTRMSPEERARIDTLIAKHDQVRTDFDRLVRRYK